MIDHLDHLVLTTANESACVDFYTRILGMKLESFIGGTPPVERKAFKYGNQKSTYTLKVRSLSLRRIFRHQAH